MSFVYQRNIFSDYIISLIDNNDKKIFPIIIFYDQNSNPSYYYALLINKKLLIKYSNKNIILINISKPVIPIETTTQTTQTIEITQQNNLLINSLIINNINTKTNPLNNFIIIDCLFDYSSLINILNEYIIYNNTKKNENSSQIVPLFQPYKIISCLNYYNINKKFMYDNFDLIYKTNFINICSNNKDISHLNSVQSYINLNQTDLLSLLVNTDNFSITQYNEIQNILMPQGYISFYKIYYLFQDSNSVINYINMWSNFDLILIKYINSLDEIQNLIKYNIVHDSIYIYKTAFNNTLLGYLLKIYKIYFISNYNNMLFINQYNMSNFDQIINLESNNIINTNELADTIYKIDGSYFKLNYYLDYNCFLYYPKIGIQIKNNIKFVKINDITNLYESIIIEQDKEQYKLLIISNFKYNFIDQIDQINQINQINQSDYLKTIDQFSNLDNYYIFFIIISKYQFRISRYIIKNNQLILDDIMKINQYYNCNILESDYVSNIFINPIIIHNNKLI
jgi:hypothetical protein